MTVPVSESVIIRGLQTDLLEQKKAYALLLHDKETADTERTLLREEVYTFYKNENFLSHNFSFPSHISHADLSDCSIAENSSRIDVLLRNLRQAYGARQIREEGSTLVSHLRDRATKKKKAFMIAEKEKYARIELETAVIEMKSRENKLMKDIEDLSQEVFLYILLLVPHLQSWHYSVNPLIVNY